MTRTRTVVSLYVAACALCIAGYFSVDAESFLGSFFYDFLAVSATGMIVYAVRRRGVQPVRGWLLIAAATACWAAGDITWGVYDYLEIPVPFPSLADIPYLLAYPLLGYGSFLIARSRGRSTGAIADAFFVAIGLALPIWIFLGQPNAGAFNLATAVGIAYPLADVVLIGFLVRLIYAPHPAASDRLLAASFMLIFVSDIIYGVQSLAGTYVPGSIVDLGWMLSYPAIGLAALVPRPATPEHEHRSEAVTPLRLAVMGAVMAVVIGLFVRAIGLPDPHVEEILIYAAVGLLIAGLVLARMRTMMHGIDGASRSLRESEARYRGMVQDSVEGIFRTSMDGIVLEANPAMAQLLGYENVHDLMAGGPVYAYYADPANRVALVEQVREHGSVVGFETQLKCPDGRLVWVRISARMAYDENGIPVAIDGIISDVTARVTADREREQALVAEREVTARLLKLDDMKNGFLTAVSHELRTPLTAVVGFADVLKEHGDTLPVADRDAFVDRISVNAQRLQRLLGDLLDVDRLSRGVLEPNLERTDLSRLITSVASASAERVGDRIRLSLEPVTIGVDAPMVERIVENLLTNAVRYSTAGTPITVGLTGTADGGALIAIENRGKAISDELKREIFEPFRQGADTIAHSPGVGIGLSIVERFTKLHGGSVWVEDGRPDGARFLVKLPNGLGLNPQSVSRELAASNT